MSDVPPIDPNAERPQRAEDPVPDPHRTEPAPPAQEGMRPGVDPAARPEQDEEYGPLEGLVKASAAEAQTEASQVAIGDEDPEAEALLAKMGVEEEGIESGQLLGLVAATLVAVAALTVILIYLFIIPDVTQESSAADGAAEYYEIADLRAEATARLADYNREDSTYTLPIGRAMGLVVAEYGSPDVAGLPDSRAEWNLLPLRLGPGRAVQATPVQPEILPPTMTELPAAASTGERVGQDVDLDGTAVLRDNSGVPVVEDPDVVDPPRTDTE